MKTIIAGSRWLYAPAFLEQIMEAIDWTPSEVVSGCARGPDLMGEQWAKSRGIPVKQFPANWDAHGKAAGPIRNKEMADYAEAAVIMWDEQSKGTKSMIDLARAAGLKVEVFLAKPAVPRRS